MWPLDRFDKLSNNMQFSLKQVFNESFGPVTSIASSIGNTIGTVTGTINESKKIAEEEAIKNVVANKDVTENKDISGNNIDSSNNIIATQELQQVPMDEKAYALMIIKYIIIYTFAFYFAMLAANQLIFEPVVYRLIIFILILIVPFIFSSLALIPFGLYYIGLILWRIYLGSTPEYKDKKISLMPKIYCMLPLTTVEGTNSFTRFFKYPFYFPQTEIAEKRLQKEQQIYENELIYSFYKWDEIVKKYPEFGNQFNLLSQQLKKLITRIPAPVEIEAKEASALETTELPK